MGVHLHGHNNNNNNNKKENDAKKRHNSHNIYREEDGRDGTNATRGDVDTNTYDMAPS